MATVIENPKAYRLPTHVRPLHYDIDLDARLGRREFFGKVTIQLDIQQPDDSIELHARDLELSSAVLTVGDRQLQGRISLDAEAEMAAISFDETLPQRRATLEIEFEGKVSEGLEGLYLAQDGPEECLCTQCEESEARAIFPCWDEPTFKAQFAWRVTTNPEHTVLANGPLVKVEDGPNPAIRSPQSAVPNSKTWHFAPTEVMSSYLVALVIGDVASTEEEYAGTTPLRVWAMRGKEHMGKFAQQYTARLFPWYEEYFGVPYHFDKYDQAAVPGFAAGAMENSGLVIYRQQYLLMDPATASWYAEKAIAHVVAHETAHMWFGNLVTMKWWDDLWLNEAFAEWVSTKAVDSLSPEYRIWDDFQASKNGAMAKDSLESTHPIYSPVETPAEVAELFDAITYEKGCAVLRMLENFLGDEPFREGIRTYMKAFAESNAEGSDLWKHLQHASDHPVSAIMESWIMQGGYPVLAVSLEGHNLHFRQKRFFSSPDAPQGNGQLWQVPVVVRYEDDTGVHETRRLMPERELTLPLTVTGDVKWCYANANEVGFYRQNPDENVLQKVLSNLDKLTPAEQTGLLNDQWALVRNGTNNITQVLDVLSALASTNDYSVLQGVVGRLHGIETLLEEAGDEEALGKFRAWVNDTFKGRLEELGFEPKEGEEQNEAQMRVSVIDAMTTLAHNEDAVRQATEWADREAADSSSVHPNLAGTFVSAAAWFGGEERFKKYVDIYQQRRGSGVSPQEVQRYLYSLSSFRPPELVARTLQLMDDGVLPQEAFGPVLRQMFGLNHAREHAWEYLKSHWMPLRKLGDMWTGFLVEASGQLPASYRDDMVSFYGENLKGLAEMSYARALETLDQLAEFKARTRDDLVRWFKDR